MGPDPDVLSKEEFETKVRDSILTISHPVGTTAISPKRSKHGVVDPELRVKGVRGLRVVDAGVIVSQVSSNVERSFTNITSLAQPYVPSGHTQAPVYALAERAVDIIRESWTL